jgi:hypothetical protein
MARKYIISSKSLVVMLLLVVGLARPAGAVGETADAFVRRIGGEAIKVMTDADTARGYRRPGFVRCCTKPSTWK